MLRWPELGTRVTVRYRRPAGSVPPLTDAVGNLLQVEPTVRIRTKTGGVVDIAFADVVAVRTLTDAPVRTSQIRALEHAAALACPGIDNRWLDGWFLRAGPGATVDVNSAVPLDISADARAIPAIADWYTRRGLTPRLAVPERLLHLPGAAERSYRMLVRDAQGAEHDPSLRLTSHPDDRWLRSYDPGTPVDVLTAVADGEVAFGAYAGMATARVAVTDARDQTRWVGVSALRLSGEARAPHAAQMLCAALLAWGAERGASRGYVRVSDDDVIAGRVVESMGFRTHHRGRYLVSAGS